MNDTRPANRLTQFGFVFGPLEVTRLFDDKGSATIEVVTAKERLTIRVTPSGLIRSGKSKATERTAA